mgnify:FL=1
MIAGIFLTVFLILLYPDPGMTPEEENNSVRLTFISPFANTGYWGTAATGILDTAEKYGMNVKCIGFAESDPQKQIRYIKSAIYSHADGIITAGIENSDEFKEVLDMASEAGIPVILIDCDIEGSDRLCYIGTDNFEAGRLAGQDIVEATEGKGSVAIIRNEKSSINQQERINGMESVIEQYPDMEIVTVLQGNQNYMIAKEQIVNMMKEYPDIDAIFCPEGYSSICISQFLQEEKEGYRDLKVVAFDMSDESLETLKQGKIYSIIQQDPYTMGQKAVEYLHQYLSGESGIQSETYTNVQNVKQERIEQLYEYRSKDVIWHTY